MPYEKAWPLLKSGQYGSRTQGFWLRPHGR